MYKCVTTVAEIKSYLDAAKVVAFDFETAPYEQYRNEEKASLNPHKAHIVGISFSTKKGSGVYVPLCHKVGKNIDNSVELWRYLSEFFRDKKIIKIAHNLAFESAFLYSIGITVRSSLFMTQFVPHS